MQAITKKRIKRGICTCVAVSLIGTGIGSTLWGATGEVYAKETLQSIETIVSEAMATDEYGVYTNPFTVLEVVPDGVVSTAIVGGIDAAGATVDENGVAIERQAGFEDIDGDGTLDIIQNAGTAGYYIKGQEPVTKDLIKYLGDAQIKDDSGALVWEKTQLTDSVSRANFAELLLEPVIGKADLVGENAGDISKPLYKAGSYKELREGEKIIDSADLDNDGNKEEILEVTGALLSRLNAENTYHYIVHDYSGKDFNVEASGEGAYIDVAKGAMTPVINIAQERGNYSLSYEPVLKEDETTGEMVLDTENDKAYRFALDIAEEQNKVYFNKVELNGEFDPFLISTGQSDSATHRATFAYVKGATSGYKVVSVSDPLSREIQDIPVGVPLYTYDEENGVYVFAGFVAKEINDGVEQLYLDTSKTNIVGLMFLEGKSAEVSGFSLLQNRTLMSRPLVSPSASVSPTGMNDASALPTITATETPTADNVGAVATPTITPSAVPTTTPKATETPAVPVETPVVEETPEPTAESGLTPTEMPVTATEAPVQTPGAESTATMPLDTAKISFKTEAVPARILMAPPFASLTGGRKVLYEQEVTNFTPTPEPESTKAPEQTPEAEPTEMPEQTPEIEPTEMPEQTPEIEPTEMPEQTPEIEPTEMPEQTPEIEPTETPDTESDVTPKETSSASPTASPVDGRDEEALPMFGMFRATTPTRASISDAENYYILEFGYVEEGDGVEPLYQVSYYDIPEADTQINADTNNGIVDDENNGEITNEDSTENAAGFSKGAQYVLNGDNRGSIVTNQNGTGIIARGVDAGEIATQFIYDYTPGVGFYNWTGEGWLADSDVRNVCRIRGAKIYFSTGLENRDWFKQYVFDREEAECAKLPVIVNTLAANDVTENDIRQSKLLLLQMADTSMCIPNGNTGPQSAFAIAGGFDYAVATANEEGCDLSAAACKEIIRKVVQESYPVVSDYRIADEYIAYSKNNSLSIEETPNIYYLVKGLTLKNLSMYYGVIGAPEAELKIVDPEDYGKVTDANGYNNVNTSVYTRNHNSFLNVEFRKPETDELVIKDGYAEVLLDIQNENIYRKTSGLEGEIPEEISQATVIRYILGYANKRAYETKGSLHILELAPCAAYTLKVTAQKDSTNDNKIIQSTIYTVTRDGMGNYKEEKLIELKETEIFLTQMTTAEFIGSVEDINAKYDMIYISSETGEYQYAGAKYQKGGNDITKDKQSDLFDFADAGYPIIVADDLMNRVQTGSGEVKLSANGTTVEEDSYLYGFINEVAGEENVFRLSNVSAPLLGLYVNLSRPSLELTKEEGESGVPTRWYMATTAVIPLEKQSDGNYLAKYEFEIENKGAGGSNETFDCQLLIDINGDGKYSDKSEDIEDIYVTDTSDNPVGKDDSGRYQLRAGGTYRVSYMISDEYHGVIPWRIRVTQNDDTNLRRGDVTGYYSVGGQAEKINVLQITSENSTFDMEKATSLDAATVFKKMLTDKATVPYDVEISSFSINQFTTAGITAKFGEDKSPDTDHNGWSSPDELLAFLRNFDVLVLGSDYNFTNTGALEAIKAYAEEGRSILITHDMTKPGIGDNFNNYLKDTIGMTESVTYSDLVKDGNDDAVDYPMLTGLDSNSYHAENISRTNQGRITMYPYLLESEHFEIGTTHAQHWQLDFTRDIDEDKETDLVVWYALENGRGIGTDGRTDGIYDASPNDARNNYYLYSMGNVFYSGIGHETVCKGSANAEGVIVATDAEVNEIKLFINTLIAAYEAGIHSPSVSIIESYQPASREITSVYVSYDDQLKAVSEAGVTAGVLDLQQDVYFIAEPASVIYNGQTMSHKFTAEFYVEMPTADGAQALSFNGSTVYGRKLVQAEGGYDGKLYYLDEAGIEQVLLADGNGSYNLLPNMVYKTRIPISVLGDFGGAIFDERGVDSHASARNSRRIFVVVKEQITNTRTQTITQSDAIDVLSIVRVQVFDLD